jgi:hypothetical protein
MDNSPDELVILARRIEALENAFTVAVHSVATALPTVKRDVIENLNRHAQANRLKNKVVYTSTKALIDRIEAFNPKVIE